MKSQHLFVYGTLRARAETWFADQLSLTATPVGLGHLRAQLFLVDYYPGVVDSDDLHHRVLGEVYTLPNGARGAELLTVLDQYEGYDPDDQVSSEYVRETRSIELLGGETLTAWVYLFNRPTDHLPLITSGDFFERP